MRSTHIGYFLLLCLSASRFLSLLLTAFLCGGCYTHPDQSQQRPLLTNKDNFEPGPNMHFARSACSAFSLANGNVLVVGGGQGPKLPAEIFDYKTREFQILPSDDPTVEWDNQGRPSICGQPLAQSEWNRAKFTKALHNSRIPAYSGCALLPNEEVLVAGGLARDLARDGDLNHSQKISIYDPLKREFTFSGKLLQARSKCTATLLKDGRVLIAGGELFENHRTKYLDSTEIFDLRTKEVVPGPKLPFAVSDHNSVCLKDGRVLLFNGIHPCHMYYGEIFDPVKNAVTLADGDRPPAGTATVVLPSGKIFTCGAFAGGYDAKVFDLSHDVFVDVGPMRESRALHAAALLGDGNVLIVGGQHDAGVSGSSFDDQPLKSTEIFIDLLDR